MIILLSPWLVFMPPSKVLGGMKLVIEAVKDLLGIKKWGFRKTPFLYATNQLKNQVHPLVYPDLLCKFQYTRILYKKQ
jgi:hypothetical protein